MVARGIRGGMAFGEASEASEAVLGLVRWRVGGLRAESKGLTGVGSGLASWGKGAMRGGD
jgi:hypothetical protein